ncbi:MAG: hypothetical protein H6Q23_2289 [Bacteroidetes bacterium]|nr:hypothetical protein [Bacteroidota bacterium]
MKPTCYSNTNKNENTYLSMWVTCDLKNQIIFT